MSVEHIKVEVERDLDDLLAMLENEHPKVRLRGCRIAFANADAFGLRRDRKPFRKIYNALSRRCDDNELTMDSKGNIVKISDCVREALQRFSQYVIQDDYQWAGYSEGDNCPLIGEIKRE